MPPVMSTLIPTVEVFNGVNPPFRKWSKGLSTYAMINEFYNHYTGEAKIPVALVKPTAPVQPQPTTAMTGAGDSAQETIVPVPATTMTRYRADVEKYEKDVEKW
ncbi:hypothetical protein AAF712_013990 [Marasmius tenuissimus]|uniref:Uncharacterized protein n=1 Tax=Marasmius tenuissimus TaxID=585030 RepID=A0ABR2ZEA6_9AGAR